MAKGKVRPSNEINASSMADIAFQLYLAGRTPIPCTLCNNFIKFETFIEMADAVGARQIATGHYARVTSDGLLRVAADPAKDQTYMLSAVAAYAAISMLQKKLSKWTIAVAAFCFAFGGIWCMHFVGMAAYRTMHSTRRNAA